jgi:hypothetical protein
MLHGPERPSGRSLLGSRVTSASRVSRPEASNPARSGASTSEQRDPDRKTFSVCGCTNPCIADAVVHRNLHRRRALWQAQHAIRPVGPLLGDLEEADKSSPLSPMDVEEGVTSAIQLDEIPNGRLTLIAGAVIVRQRPGTAKGFVFLSLEDETGVMNAIITPTIFDQYKQEVLSEPFLLIYGPVQKLDGVVSVKAARIQGLRGGAAATSHDFH